MTDEKAPTAEWLVFTAGWLCKEWLKQATLNYGGAWHGMASAINARLAAEGFSLGTPPATIASALEAAAQIAERRGQKKTARDIRALAGTDFPDTLAKLGNAIADLTPGDDHDGPFWDGQRSVLKNLNERMGL